jgi:hypothetical protein
MSQNTFITLTHYNLTNTTSNWYIKNKNNGIGNMLFQIASGINYSLKNNAILYVPSLNTYFSLEELNKENTIFKNINTEIKEEYSETNIHTHALNSDYYIFDQPFYNNINLMGYFENHNNFDENRNLILNYFRPSINDKEYILNKYPIIYENNLCSIHIRRGSDYTTIYNDEELRIMELSYFELLDHMINIKNITNFFVLTNDKEYCELILNNNEKYKNINFYYSNERDYIDIWIISLIKNNLLSKSTLSWWGSYLNENDDKYIVANTKNYIISNVKYPDWTYI